MGHFMSFYTYLHSSPTGIPFYVGKGVDDRAFSFSKRSHDWKRAVKHYDGLSIKIIAEWNTEQEAFEHEKVLISVFKGMGYSLANKTEGGLGQFGMKHTEETKRKKSLLLKGYVHKKITCPKCGKTGGQTTMKRWHFDKCTGLRPYKARVTIDGKRIYLGLFETKKLALDAEIKAYNDANKPFPKEFIKRKGL